MDMQLDELQWKSPEWIQAFGLRTDNVLDYFSESPFFDKTSNNHVIRMQQQFDIQQQQQQQQDQQQQNIVINGSSSGFSANGSEKHVPVSEYPVSRQYILQNYPVHYHLEKEMRKLNKGIEYVLFYVREPDLWVVRKQEKIDSGTWKVLSNYYIIGANVYMAPQLGKVIGSRMLSTNLHLSNALSKLAQLTNGFTPSQGFGFVKTTVSPTSPTSSSSVSSLASSNFGNASAATPSSSAPASVAAQTSLTGQTSSIFSPALGKTPAMHQNPLAATQTAAAAAAAAAAGSTSMGINTMDTGLGTSVSSGNREVLSKDVADRLLITSIKSEPTYI